jgi:hypothetical protein
MLSKKSIAYFRKVVADKFPNWIGFNTGLANESTFTRALPPELKGMRIPTLQTMIMGCCGAAKLKDSESDSLCVSYLGVLATWSPVEKALYALYLNDNPGRYYGLLFCISVNGNPKTLTDVEKVLVDLGFHPISRAMNRAHGPNYLTTWLLNTMPGQIMDGLVPSLFNESVDGDPTPGKDFPVLSKKKGVVHAAVPVKARRTPRGPRT